MDYLRHSKESHKNHFSNKGFSSTWYNQDVDDTKRHFMLLSEFLPVAEATRPKSILTIGDSLGRDGVFLKRNIPNCHVTVSDLETTHLNQLLETGMVDKVENVDVESIPYPDDHFDLVVIKESFHHFPRPWLGFYECARVARLGVLMLEPADVQTELVLTYPGRSSFRDAYESVGNYKYQVNIRESQKVCWAMGWSHLVAKGVNDPYPSEGDIDIPVYEKQKAKLDKMGALETRADNLLALGFLKERLTATKNLNDMGFRVFDKPLNPYLS